MQSPLTFVNILWLAVAMSERQPLSHLPVTLGRKRFGPHDVRLQLTT
jgi:hypothetical protein